MGALRTYFSEHHEDVATAEWVNGILRTAAVMHQRSGFDDATSFRKNAYKEFDYQYTTNYNLKADIVKQALEDYIKRKDRREGA